MFEGSAEQFGLGVLDGGRDPNGREFCVIFLDQRQYRRHLAKGCVVDVVDYGCVRADWKHGPIIDGHTARRWAVCPTI